MEDEAIRYGWDQFEEYCKMLAASIKLESSAAIAVLVTEREDGLFIGRMLEHLKGVTPYELNYRSVGEGKNISFELVGPFPPGLSNRTVYLVSAAAFYGRKLRQAANDLKDHGNKVKFAVIHYFTISKVKPHIHLFELEGEIRHIDYPWKEEKG